MPAQTQKAAPPPAPPAPPKASDATAATRSLIRDIASQRSRQTTVLTRRRDKLTPGSMDWPVNQSTVLTQPLTPVGPPPSTLPPPPLAPPGPGMPAPVTGTGTAGTNIGGATILGPQVGGPGGQLGSLVTAVNTQNSPSPTYGYFEGGAYTDTNAGTPVQIVAGVDEHVPFNQVTDYLM